MSKVTENLALIKSYTEGLGGEALQAALAGFENSLGSADKSAISQNWAEVKKNCAGIVHAKGYLNGDEGATAEDLERAIEKVDEGLSEQGEAKSMGSGVE